MHPNLQLSTDTALKDKIEVEIHNRFDKLAELQSEWDAFIEGIGGEIFLTYDWCQTWWKYYGEKRDLAIFIFRHQGDICGILPLFNEKLRIGPLSISVIKIVGSDHVPVSFAMPIKNEFIDLAVSLLKAEIAVRWSHWHLLHIGSICGRYDNPGNLLNSFRSQFGNGYRCELKATDVQSYISVAPDWESQVARLSSDQRTGLRRTFKETTNKHIAISNRLASKETLAQSFDRFVQMHQEHWQGIGRAGHFGAWPLAKSFHQEVAEKQLEHDRLRLIETSFNGIAVGYQYIYRFQDTYYWFLNARSVFEGCARISFKWIALRAKIENALKDGVHTIDAMRGPQDYKLLLGGKTLPIHSLFIYSSRIPVLLRISTFRLFSRTVHIIYYKIWRDRVAPRLGIRLKPFWQKWVRIHQLSV